MHNDRTFDREEKPTEVNTVEVRQATGPREMFTVLAVSMLLAIIVGTGLLVYFLG